jgi:hypothetical protein
VAEQPLASKRFFRATLLGDGRLGPIEQRIGRRLCRIVDPESSEGEMLLKTGEVDLVGPDGEKIGRVRLAEALSRLQHRLECRLSDASADPEAEILREGLSRIQARVDRIGNA